MGKKLLIGATAGALGTAGTTMSYALGPSIASTQDQLDPIDNTMAVLGSIGVAGASAYGLQRGISKGYDYLSRNEWENARRIGTSIGKHSAVAGAGIADVGVTGLKTVGKTAGNILAGTAKTAVDNLIDYNPEKYDNLLGTKLKGKAKLLLGAYALGSSLLGADKTYSESRMGNDFYEQLVTSTPTFSDEENPSLDRFQSRSAEAYGASGDLVFALNRNRRG